jgi:para-nitrobenzyl esterase
MFVLAVTACSSDKTSSGGSPEGGVNAEAGPEPSSGGATGSGGSTGNGGAPHHDAGAPDAGDAGFPPGPIVTLDDGQIESDQLDGVLRFLKVPFAKPPVGDLRWKAPVKNDAWTGLRHEKSYPVPCPQQASQQGPASNNEDCLYLNVWAPSPLPKKAPVMVWIHGGGNFAGGTGDLLPGTKIAWYDGQFFARNHGVVLVSMEYRLGPIGFFAHPALAAEKSPLGNQGLLDQRRSLEWVKDNIAKFGGDPGNVTIFGESAGSADVCFQVASPGSRGLFHRAVSESGGCTVPLSGGKDDTAASIAATMESFAKSLGCDKAKDVLACLRGKSIEDVMNLAMQPDPSSGMALGTPFSVVVDGPGGFLPDSPRNLFDAGDVAKVPYLLGSNNDEGTLFLLGATPPKTEDDYEAELKNRFGAMAPKVLALYPVSNFGGDYLAALVRVVTDSGLVCGTHDTARRAAKAGLPVFMYNFNVPWALAPDVFHASHASEISHVFGNPYTPMPDAASVAVGTAMNAYWSEFAVSGDPNYKGAPATWPAFAPDADAHDERLQLDPQWKVVKDFRRDECTFWREVYDQGEGIGGDAGAPDAGTRDAG